MSPTNSTQVFSAVQTVGGLLPADMLVRIAEGKDVPGTRPADYRVFGSRSVQDEAERHWDYLRSLWADLRNRLPVAPEAEAPVDPTGVAISQWLMPLFAEFGFGALTSLGAAGIVADDGTKTFPVSHRWTHVLVHLTPWQDPLDKRVAGAVPAQSLLQECLNRTEAHLWAIVSNGRRLRLLRDSNALATSAYVEFDLEAIFDGELFSEFLLLYRLLHVTRFAVDEGAAPSACWLERWRGEAITSGARALDQLREGVQQAITTLGTGFLRHPDNVVLRDAVDTAALHGALLRLVYRLLFLFVAEDRDVLHEPEASDQARARYAAYFSTARLRAHALRRRGTAHSDLYAALRIVLDALGDERGRPELGLPGLGGIFDPAPADEPLRGLALANEHLLESVRHLARVRDVGSRRWRSVDYRHLDAEELGSIYESLLELVPRHNAVDREFVLESAAGNARKTTGSYYTPSSLIELLLDSALDPVIDDAVKRGEQVGGPDPSEAIVGELLSLTVCDPACGSGHFLVAAARRIAKRVAAVREGNPEPTLPSVRTALHEAIARCIYGVDLNPMAVELAKVSLWLEALEPGKPLSFLDAHVKCGNALIGATPRLLQDGIPDEAFKPIVGDDPAFARALAKQSRTSQMTLFDEPAEVRVANVGFAREFRAITGADVDDLADVHKQAAQYAELAAHPDYQAAQLTADAWCAAFLWHKTADAPKAVTQDVFLALQDPSDRTVPSATRAEIARLREQYRFLHWHLAFPEIFAVPPGDAGVDAQTGWAGGFSCVVGNPPWEMLQLEEKQFFASHGRTDIANSGTAANRRRKISDLAAEGSPLYAVYRDALRVSDGVSHMLRKSGRVPLTGTGKINTYSVFAETDWLLTSPDGRTGLIIPTGIATDDTTKRFFQAIIDGKHLVSLLDFRNAGFFPDVAGAQGNRFCLLTLQEQPNLRPVDLVARASEIGEVQDPARRVEIDAEMVRALNPNTCTLPLFRGRVDAEITLGVYRRFPVIVRDSDGMNPWALAFRQGLFNMASDSDSFLQSEGLADARFDGWSYRNGDSEFLPLYEAKMVHHYSHRFGDYLLADIKPNKEVRAIPTPPLASLDDPDFEVTARHWVDRKLVSDRLKGRAWTRSWLIGWRDVTSSLDSRTFVPAVIPTSAVGDPLLLAFPGNSENGPLLQAVWSSFAFDYVARQKVGGTHMTFSVVKQLACPTPATFAEPCPWQPDRSLAEWVVPYVLELSYTSWRLQPYAQEMHDDGPPFRWDPERRTLLRADLDAAFLHVYGLTRPEAEHVLDSFFVVRKYEERDHGEFRTKRLVLDAFDRMAAATAGGPAWTPLAPVPAGQGSRHPAR